MMNVAGHIMPVGRFAVDGRTSSPAGVVLARFWSKHGPARAPVPIEAIASWLGFQIVALFTAGDEFSGLVSIPQKLIAINGNHHPHRRRFSVAHELAHIILKHPAEARCTASEIARYNVEADQCASELLVPRFLLLHWLQRTRNVRVLADIFNVSVEAMTLSVRMRTHPANRPRSVATGGVSTR